MILANDITLVAAFVIGLSGGLHCLVMCGGISSALGYAASTHSHKQFIFALCYNLGRICSYAFIGLLFGAAFSLIDNQHPIAHRMLQLLSAFLLIVIGLHISGLFTGFTILEIWGSRFWKLLQPLALKLFPVNTLSRALGLGLFWGWLPCGLVYSTLAWSATAAAPLKSAAMMAAFGAGTLPWLLATTLAGQQFTSLAKSKALRRALGALLVALGIYMFYNSLPTEHHHH